MFQTNMIHSLLKGLDPIHQKSISLSPGQIFSGKIIKLYPGQLASLQLGGQTLTAKLEAALTAGNRYWFQVQPGDGIPNLKVLEGSSGQRTTSFNDNEMILKQLGLSNTKLNEKVVNFLANKEIPFSQTHVNSGSKVLQSLSKTNERGLSILQILIERNLPITTTSFLAVQSVVEAQSLSIQLEQLSQLLQKTTNTNQTIVQLQRALQSYFHEATVKIDENKLINMLINFFKADETSRQFIQSENELQKLGIIEKATNPEQWLGQIKEKLMVASEDQLRQLWPTLTKSEVVSSIDKHSIETLFSKLVIPAGEKGEKILQQLLQLFQNNQKQNTLMQATVNFEEKATFAKQLSTIAQSIGFQYEREVLRAFQPKSDLNDKLLTQLKSLLIKVQQTDLPVEIKDKSEVILHRITGQQLLSANPEGPISNQVFVFPLKLRGRDVDLTIQWESKKGKNGELDPNHCRILFYVDLDHLKETIVDVQIQNKIVSLHIYNEIQRPNQLINVLQPHLREALLDLNYQLSGIKWTQSKDTNNRKIHPKQINNYYSSQTAYQGVDIRI